MDWPAKIEGDCFQPLAQLLKSSVLRGHSSVSNLFDVDYLPSTWRVLRSGMPWGMAVYVVILEKWVEDCSLIGTSQFPQVSRG